MELPETLNAASLHADGSVAVEECCADWTPQTKKIDGFIVLQSLRAGNPNLYDGIPFRYCPWCGKARPQNAPDQPPRN